MSCDVVQQITGIATLLTALAALATILEMRRQRTAGYRPVVTIDDVTVSIWKPTQRGSVLLVEPASAGILSSHDHSNVPFRVRNVGAGPALELEAQWDFDALEFAAALASIDPTAGAEIAVDETFVTRKSPGHLSWMARRRQVHHLGTLPASSDARASIHLPSAYQLLAAAYFDAVLSHGLDGVPEWNIPGLSLCVPFRDREGQRHESRYRVTFDLVFVSSEGSPIAERPDFVEIGAGAFRVRPA